MDAVVSPSAWGMKTVYSLANRIYSWGRENFRKRKLIRTRSGISYFAWTDEAKVELGKDLHPTLQLGEEIGKYACTLLQTKLV